MDWGFAAFAARPLFGAGSTVGSARVQDGEASSVPLIAPVDYAASGPAGTHDPIRLAIVYDGPLKAPIRKGSVVADLQITVGSAPPNRVPLIAGADVARAGPFTRLLNGLRGLI